ncbi:CAF17-like 4Fe-4S cluster assembly/insertion protein YgfZ [Halomonas sp. V046]|uniref:CAF17-like 4Fe-4S cluster assembly/insertion protein YgfZ n=1 Tax=Halomonas sp. V046 TaxID=3459611 RepID=UPI0040444E8B
MTDWISSLGGQTTAPYRVEFDTPDSQRKAQEATVTTPLAHLGALDVTGPDAERFLQGQTSAQLTLADGNLAPLTAFCTPKGRMLANGQLAKVGEHQYRLIVHASLVEPLARHLGKFAAFYQATLTPRDDLALIGVIGQEATALVEVDCDLTPPKTWHQAGAGDRLLLAYPGPQPRYLVCTPQQHAPELFQRLADQSHPVGNAVWCLADIQAGLAFIDRDQQDSYLPQMFNWEALAGISFKKGCYTGQEVVARAHFRGQVKKRLVRAQLEGSDIPDLGSEVIDDDGKRVGEVVAAQRDAYGQAEVLAVMSTRAEGASLTIGGQTVKPLRLPYALTRLDPETLAD